MSMDKITKEELKNLFGGKALSDDELEMVAGGSKTIHCLQKAEADLQGCLAQGDTSQEICSDLYWQFMAECKD